MRRSIDLVGSWLTHSVTSNSNNGMETPPGGWLLPLVLILTLYEQSAQNSFSKDQVVNYCEIFPLSRLWVGNSLHPCDVMCSSFYICFFFVLLLWIHIRCRLLQSQPVALVTSVCDWYFFCSSQRGTVQRYDRVRAAMRWEVDFLHHFCSGGFTLNARNRLL